MSRVFLLEGWQVVLEGANAASAGNRNRHADQEDPDDHEHEPDATRGTDSDEATQGGRQRAALTEQGVENAVGEDTGDRVGHDVTELGDQPHETPDLALGLVGYGGPGDDLDARVERREGHEEGEGQHADGQDAGGGSQEEDENTTRCQETRDVGEVGPLHVEHADDQARNDHAHGSDGADHTERGLVREIEQHRGEQGLQEAHAESDHCDQSHQHGDARMLTQEPDSLPEVIPETGCRSAGWGFDGPPHQQHAHHRQNHGGDVDHEHRRDSGGGHQQSGDGGGDQVLGCGGQLDQSSGPGVLLGGEQVGDGGPIGGIHDGTEHGTQRHTGADDGDAREIGVECNDHGEQTDCGESVAEDHQETAVIPVGKYTPERGQQQRRQESGQCDE